MKIDNFYMFKDTEFDFTYPKKIANSTIEGEFLTDFPKINYKKVCILMGANASGKTSLGKTMCFINNYLAGRDVKYFSSSIGDKKKSASAEIIYITPQSKEIHKLLIKFDINRLIFEQHTVCKLKKTSNLKATLLAVENSTPRFTYDENNKHGIENPGFKSVAHSLGRILCEQSSIWCYLFSDSNSNDPHFIKTYTPNISILEGILKSFDNSILSVSKISESEGNSYIVKFANKDEVFIKDGVFIKDSEMRLSRGTIESIEVADFLHHIKSKDDCTFFLDEKMAYSHSEIEISILNLIIEKLKPNSQFFYTTHNYDILAMNLPSHSYTFMRKNEFVEVLHPEKLGYTKNDRSLLGYVKNDVFGTLPDTSKIENFL
ncbi:ATP-binding protein [Bathymodiolus thermophilus thioautotrophic gill symbiont]|uniref:ATP-binding protein n=1 Tax=Bathymodiolus thermophilus thioautotrophic gill symbiont TaxID=2360 RepID=UPI0013E0ABC7|nr:ATP-binding protein [Bathymodiolus thermophilus thioautotrophic gill symbiont]